MTVDIYDKNYKKVGEINLPENVFGVVWNPKLVHQVTLAQLANRRVPVAHAKDRSEVRGGGKKPYAQKHTGRSRQGSIRSPLWSGGGATFGPRNDRDFSQKINKKTKRNSLFSLLSEKQRVGEIFVIDTLELKEVKTKIAADIVSKFLNNKKESVMFIPSKEHMSFSRAGKNISKVAISGISGLNTYDCATSKYIIFEKDAIEELSKLKEI